MPRKKTSDSALHHSAFCPVVRPPLASTWMSCLAAASTASAQAPAIHAPPSTT
ncbi:MAG: hypothetical protein WAL13_27375 [Trebonia sp.]